MTSGLNHKCFTVERYTSVCSVPFDFLFSKTHRKCKSLNLAFQATVVCRQLGFERWKRYKTFSSHIQRG
jgi:hypothetical protein